MRRIAVRSFCPVAEIPQVICYNAVFVVRFQTVENHHFSFGYGFIFSRVCNRRKVYDNGYIIRIQTVIDVISVIDSKRNSIFSRISKFERGFPRSRVYIFGCPFIPYNFAVRIVTASAVKQNFLACGNNSIRSCSRYRFFINSNGFFNKRRITRTVGIVF